MKKKYISKVNIDESLINSNLDGWYNFCIFGKINDRDLSLLINTKFIIFDYDNIHYKIKVDNYSFTAEKIIIDNCLTIYKKNNNVKLTFSIDECVLYLDVIESKISLLKEDVDYFSITTKLFLNEDNFIFIDEKEDINKSELCLVRFNENIPIILKHEGNLIVITKSNLWNKGQINRWILYEDLLIYNNDCLVNLNDCIKYYPRINES